MRPKRLTRWPIRAGRRPGQARIGSGAAGAFGCRLGPGVSHSGPIPRVAGEWQPSAGPADRGRRRQRFHPWKWATWAIDPRTIYERRDSSAGTDRFCTRHTLPQIVSELNRSDLNDCADWAGRHCGSHHKSLLIHRLRHPRHMFFSLTVTRTTLSIEVSHSAHFSFQPPLLIRFG